MSTRSNLYTELPRHLPNELFPTLLEAANIRITDTILVSIRSW